MRRPPVFAAGAAVVAVAAVAVAFIASPGGSVGLTCHGGQVGGVLLTPSPDAQGYPTPGEAAEEATETLSDLVDSLDFSKISSELFEAESSDLEALINVHQLPSGGYLIESIDYCYTGPDLGPVYPEDTGSAVTDEA